MKLLNFKIIQLTTGLIAGICIGYYFKVSVLYSGLALAISLLILAIFYVKDRKRFQSQITFDVISVAVMLFIGVVLMSKHDQRLHQNHYTNFNVNDSINTSILKIKSTLKASKYQERYIAEVLNINGKDCFGKIQLNISKDSINKPLHVDNVILTSSKFQEIYTPKNPFQFNYQQYLEKQQVYKQVNIDKCFLIDSNTSTIYGWADKLRLRINNNLKATGFNSSELAIVNALLLGQRQFIETEVYDNYVNAGAIHILAVSGLHVGVIFVILSYLLAPLARLKNGAILKALLVVMLLWCFAIITGLSASVIRAVTMFTCFALADTLKRPTNSYNTLILSGFVILLVKPILLFDVGFQLSYLAVFSIISFQPIFNSLWYPKNWIIRLFWGSFWVGIAAQIGVLPLSLFYFHQFPGLFFIANLIIVPFLPIVLGFGVLVILLSALNILPNILALCYEKIISVLNFIIEQIAKQEMFLFQDISFNWLNLISVYALIICLFLFIKKKTQVQLKWMLASVILVQAVLLFNKKRAFDLNETIVFNSSKRTLIGNTLNKQLSLLTNDSISASNNAIKNYAVGSFINTITKDSLQNIYNFNNKTMLIVDSLGIYTSSFKPNIVLLSHSPKINLNRLIDTLHPELIIADGSNYKSYVNRWKVTCKHKKTPFHYTYENGAYTVIY